MSASKSVGLIALSASALLTFMVARSSSAQNGPDAQRANDSAIRSCSEQTRGDGTIVVGEGRRDRARFHVRSTQNDSGAVGSFDFRDRTGAIRLASKNLLTYETVDVETRRLTFDLGGGDGTSGTSTAVVTLRDLGRRGRSDFFEISSGDYFASGNLRGGQVRIQHRGRNCDGTVPERGAP